LGGGQTLKSTQAMGEAMKGVTVAMGKMNAKMNLPALHNIMREFEKQNEKMEMTSETMGDAIDDALEVRGGVRGCDGESAAGEKGVREGNGEVAPCPWFGVVRWWWFEFETQQDGRAGRAVR
jgi:hypothetical protein